MAARVSPHLSSDLKGCRVLLRTYDVDVEGVVNSVSTDTSRITLVKGKVFFLLFTSWHETVTTHSLWKRSSAVIAPSFVLYTLHSKAHNNSYRRRKGLPFVF